MLEQVICSSTAGDTTVHDTAEQCAAAKAIAAVHATGQFATGPETRKGCGTIVDEHTGLVVDLDAAHGKMQDGLHERNVEFIIDVEGVILEEFLSEGIFSVARGVVVVVVERGFELFDGDAHFLSEGGAGFKMAHESAAFVVFYVPLDFLCGFGVEDESDGEVVALPHCVGDHVAFLEFVDESVSTGIEEQTANATEGFGGKELDFGTGIFRIDKSR